MDALDDISHCRNAASAAAGLSGIFSRMRVHLHAIVVDRAQPGAAAGSLVAAAGSLVAAAGSLVIVAWQQAA
jgi:hypothetical protein